MHTQKQTKHVCTAASFTVAPNRKQSKGLSVKLWLLHTVETSVTKETRATLGHGVGSALRRHWTQLGRAPPCGLLLQMHNYRQKVKPRLDLEGTRTIEAWAVMWGKGAIVYHKQTNLHLKLSKLSTNRVHIIVNYI